jgi:hypothetical protein
MNLPNYHKLWLWIQPVYTVNCKLQIFDFFNPTKKQISLILWIIVYLLKELLNYVMSSSFFFNMYRSIRPN